MPALNITYDHTVRGVSTNNLFDLLSGTLSGGNGTVGVTVGVVQVKDIYRDICPQARHAQYRGSVPEVTCNKNKFEM